MRTYVYIVGIAISALLTGCASSLPQQSDSPIRHSSPDDFSLVLSHNAGDSAFDLALKNTSDSKLWHNLLSPHFTVWAVRKDAAPLQLFDPSSTVCIYPNPLPIMQPDETHRFTIPIEPLGALQFGKIDLNGALVFVEYSMGKRSLFSTAIKIDQPLVIGKEWPTNGSTPTK